MRQRSTNQRAWLGVFLVLLGSYFLFRNFDMIPYWLPDYLFGWESIFVVVGATMLLTGRREGFIFMCIGGFFLLDEIFDLPSFHFRDWWPLIMIIIGLSIILKRGDYFSKNQQEIGDDYLEDTAVFGGSEKSFTSQNFRGGKITAVFGGTEINLSSAQIGDREAILDVFCMFGGHTFIVPNDWTVINESLVMFGGYSDDRSSAVRNPDKILRIKGTVMFGGAEIKGA